MSPRLPSEAAGAAWSEAPGAAWASGIRVSDDLALREGRRAIIVVAPHGGRRRRDVRRGDSVNDLHTADIAWELAARIDAHAIVNHGLDRNEIDLNRISHLVERAPEVLALLSAAIDAAARTGDVPLVLFVHGWNMVVPCCDVGIGLRRRAGRWSGRHPTLSRARFETTVARIEQELEARGVSAAIGRRYTASGRDNAAQLFSGRFATHDHPLVAHLARLALAGRVDAAQLELGIPLRWEGPRREALLAGLVDALCAPAPLLPPANVAAPPSTHEAHRLDWRLPPVEQRGSLELPEPGTSLQAVLDETGDLAMFAGVEATGPRSMAARFSVVASDGSMMLLVGEGEWGGEPGRYELEGFTWSADRQGSRIEIALAAPMIRYPTHDAYLDLESGLAASRLVDADVRLVFEATGDAHGRLTGHVRAGGLALDVETTAFVDRGGRRSMDPRERLRIVGRRRDGSVFVERSHTRESATLRFEEDAGRLGTIRATGTERESGAIVEAEVTARVPVWRPIGDSVLVRWTFGIVRCRHAGSEEMTAGLFESLEIFGRTGGSFAMDDDAG